MNLLNKFPHQAAQNVQMGERDACRLQQYTIAGYISNRYYSVGISEPAYGAAGIRTVSDQAKEKSYTELSKDDFKWEIIDSTCVETKTFYMLSDEGLLGLAQVIYSNVMYTTTTDHPPEEQPD